MLAVNTYNGWYSPDPLANLASIEWRSPVAKPLILSEFGADAKYGLTPSLTLDLPPFTLLQRYFLRSAGVLQTYLEGTGLDVERYDAPKATLMSYIIKGILSRELPWGLVLLGVMITIVLELSGVPSLAFAVGVYLPISTSAPIFVGGAVRWLVDKYLRKKPENRELTEEQARYLASWDEGT